MGNLHSSENENIQQLRKQQAELMTTNQNILEKIQHLQSENQSLSQAKKLRSVTQTLIHNRLGEKGGISKEIVEKYVDEMLKNPDINITYIPDIAERQIYINVFMLILKLIDDLSDDCYVEFVGHKIGLQVNH